MQNDRTKHIDQHDENKNAEAQEDRHCNIAGIIMGIIFKEAQSFHHRILRRSHHFTLADNILTLKVNDVLHILHGLLACLFCGCLIDDHVGFYACAQNGRHNHLHQGKVYAVSHNLLDRGNGIRHFAFADTAVQSVLYSPGDIGHHDIEIFFGNGHQHGCLITGQ